MSNTLNFASKTKASQRHLPFFREESDSWASKNLAHSAYLNQTPKTEVKRHFRRLKPARVLKKNISDRQKNHSRLGMCITCLWYFYPAMLRKE